MNKVEIKNNKMKKDNIDGAILGLVIGDALGVPVEFKSRKFLAENPVTDMLAYGTHNQKAGTWSDDSSLTFCLMESMCRGYDLQNIANKFLAWRNEEIWTAHGKVFDIGIATNQAIKYIKNGHVPTLCGGMDESDNGNGSLMRILPIAFYIKDFAIEKRFKIVSDVSCITHAHIRSRICCFIYIEFVLKLLSGKEKIIAFEEMKNEVSNFLYNEPIFSQNEIDKLHRILQTKVINEEKETLVEIPESEINSSGYVLSSLEASLWCFLKSNSYEDAVLKAVNLGEDTDTTAAITGGLAGLYYGLENIPQKWIDILARKNDILNLINNFKKSINRKP